LSTALDPGVGHYKVNIRVATQSLDRCRESRTRTSLAVARSPSAPARGALRSEALGAWIAVTEAIACPHARGLRW
jgi:hypothetical protein